MAGLACAFDDASVEAPSPVRDLSTACDRYTTRKIRESSLQKIRATALFVSFRAWYNRASTAPSCLGKARRGSFAFGRTGCDLRLERRVALVQSSAFDKE